MVGAACLGVEGEAGQRVRGSSLSSPQASCLCGSAPCILCGCCPSSRNSTISRLIFTSFLFLGVLVSIIMLSPGVESQLHNVSSPRGWGLGWGGARGVQRPWPLVMAQLLGAQAWGPI